MYILNKKKLRILKINLMVWNKTKFRNMHTKDFEAEKVITNIQIEINRTDLTDFLQKKRKRKLILRLPSMWKAFF